MSDYISVSQLTKYIKYKMDNDIHLQEVYLKGEISNFKLHTRGHFYFTLKDEGSRINAIMFASNAKSVKFKPEDGMKVLVTGKISVYEATGGYQIYVSDMSEDGVGNLYIAFEQLKKKLAEKGLFAQEHKQKIPRIPAKVGVVTASTGAAIRDIVSTISRRFPTTEILLFPSLVQGEFAKDDIVRQIKRAQEYDLDVLIVGRGGGSIEDLWAFNEEVVAEAIYQCQIPVISAVGHEIDFTIADFVADLRAPTPTGAAEMAVPSKVDVLHYIEQLKIRADKAIYHRLTKEKDKLTDLQNHYIFKNPLDLYSAKSQKLDYFIEKLETTYRHLLDKKRQQLAVMLQKTLFQRPPSILQSYQQHYILLINKLEILSPLKTLQRGYTIAKKEGIPVISIAKLKPHDKIEIEFQDGSVSSEVIRILERK